MRFEGRRARGDGAKNGRNGGRRAGISGGRSFIGTDRANGQGSGGRHFSGGNRDSEGRRAEIDGYRDRSRSGTMRMLPPGATEKPRTEVRAFLDGIWKTC